MRKNKTVAKELPAYSILLRKTGNALRDHTALWVSFSCKGMAEKNGVIISEWVECAKNERWIEQEMRRVPENKHIIRHSPVPMRARYPKCPICKLGGFLCVRDNWFKSPGRISVKMKERTPQQEIKDHLDRRKESIDGIARALTEEQTRRTRFE
jgi:hypothetical protein